MSQPLLAIVKAQYTEAINALFTDLDRDMRSYYEGRRDVLSELLITLNLMEQK